MSAVVPPPDLVDAFARAGQAQVFAFWPQLDEAGRAALVAQAREIDLAEVKRLADMLLGAAAAGVDLTDLEPAPYEALPESGGDAGAWAQARAAGEEALRAGRVAAFTVAGGQGTRLGYDGPKGTFPITPVRHKPLFQVFAEKIRASGRRYGREVHWFIMTSHANHAATEAFFAEHRHFGLDPARVHCFRQGRMPAMDFSGKILLEAPGAIALSPDGHGGSLRALARHGALDLMRAEGIDTISYFQVDNPLVRCLDPAFLGWHLRRGAEMSAKMVPKAYPEEKLGHFCRQRGRIVVIEYSDLPLATQRETDSRTGRLRYLAGSIAIHVLDREFVRRMAGGAGPAPALPFHRADKKIATVDAAGRPVKPDRPNGVKFELFVFDALPFARSPTIVETQRAEDFSPVKNADGVDSPRTAREDQLRQAARWLRAAGAAIATDASGLPAAAIEIAPGYALDAESLAARWSRGGPPPEVRDGLYLE